MNKVAVFYDKDGRIIKVRRGAAASVDVQVENDPADAIVYESGDEPSDLLSAGIENLYVDVSQKALAPKPGRPSPTHDFDYTSKSWVENLEKYNQNTLSLMRQQRTELLFDSDWTQVPDAPLTDEQRAAWREYRQQLRDITDEYPDATDINTVQWPTPPSV